MNEQIDIKAFFDRPVNEVARDLGYFWTTYDNLQENDVGQAKIITARTTDGLGHFRVYRAIAYTDTETKRRFPGSNNDQGRAKDIEDQDPGTILIYPGRNTILTFAKTQESANVWLESFQEANSHGAIIDEKEILRPLHFARRLGIDLEGAKKLIGHLYPFILNHQPSFYLAVGDYKPTTHQLKSLEKQLQQV